MICDKLGSSDLVKVRKFSMASGEEVRYLLVVILHTVDFVSDVSIVDSVQRLSTHSTAEAGRVVGITQCLQHLYRVSW